MKSIGILGGGQLSRLMASQAKALPVQVFVLSPKKTDPANQKNIRWIQGDPNNTKDLKKFFSLVDIVTFESEFFPAENLQKALSSLKGKKPQFAPSLKALSMIQDRWNQKNLLLKNKIKVADFVKIHFHKSTDIQKKLFRLWEKMGPFVLKQRRGGYDGYGTFIIKQKKQIKNIKQISGFFIAEKYIPFKREMAILSARNKEGKIIFFPLVESFQKQSVCLWVKGPARHKKINTLKKQIRQLLTEIDYQGVIAFELFDTGETLLINELAPRVHNSGHYSLNALDEDQFTIHLKAITNQSLRNPKALKKAFAMLNLLGEGYKKPFFMSSKKSDKNFLKSSSPLSLNIKKNIHFCWYGKSISRKGRKMGHINSTGESPKKSLNPLLKIRDLFKI